LMATGVGGPLGANLITGGVGNIAGEIQGDRQAELLKQQQVQQGAQQALPPNMQTFAKGGYIKQMPQGGKVPVELEKDEVVMDSKGIFGLKGNKEFGHDQGGAPMMLEPGAKVLGKMKDKDSGKTFKELGKELAKKNAKLGELEETSKNKYTLNSIKAMKQKYRQNFDAIFNRQEAMRTTRPTAKMATGGNPTLTETIASTDYTYPVRGMDFMSGIPNDTINPMAATQQVGPINTADNNSMGFFNNNSNALTTAAQLAPVAYNLFQGLQKPEQERLPGQFNEGLSALKGRRANIQAMLESNRTNQAIADYNLKQSGAGAGRVGSGRLANYGARLRGDQAAQQYASQANNQYAADYAQGLFRTGAGQMQIDQNNAMNRAARDAHLGMATSQLGEFAGIKEYQSNLKDRESQMYDMYGNWYPYLSKWAGTKASWGIAQ